MVNWVYADGGRKVSGYKGKTGDCAARAISIATGQPYEQVYNSLNYLAKNERIGKRKWTISNSRTGVYRQTVQKYFEEIGWTWVPCMGIGTGCQVHLKQSELPPGRLVVSLSRHYAAVIDGVLHDTYDCSREGTRCVYGYWMECEN